MHTGHAAPGQHTPGAADTLRRTGCGATTWRRQLVVLVLLVAACWLLGAAPAAADPPPLLTPTPVVLPGSGTPVPGGSGGPLDWLPDPRAWAAEVFNQVMVSMVQGLTDTLQRTVQTLMASPLNFISRTPPEGSYASPTVIALWSVTRLIADGAVGLLAMWGGFSVMAHRQHGVPYHEVLELLPRLVLGMLLANTSLFLAQQVIDLNNGLCGVIGLDRLPAWQATWPPAQLLADELALLVYLLIVLLLVLQMLMRLALLAVLLVLAPLAAVCWILPQTQGWSRLWVQAFTATVFTQFLQVVALKLGGAMLTDLTPAPVTASTLELILGIAVLALVLRLPALLARPVSGGLRVIRASIISGGRGRGGP